MSFATKITHCKTVEEILIECEKLLATEGASKEDIQTAQNILQMTSPQQETLLQIMQQSNMRQ